MRGNFRYAAGWVSGIVLLITCGCGKDVELGSVSGVVTKGGKPLDQIYVQFMPDPESAEENASSSTAITDEQGRFSLSYGRSGKRSGAVIGRHLVTLEDLASENHRGEGAPPAPRIPPNYMRPWDSPLECDVKAGQQTVNLQIP